MQSSVTAATETALLEAARRGDEQAFEELIAPYRRPLHVHCYRMLGSFHDADDALQDTLLRAWRALSRYEHRGALRAWLYRIATNACLRAIERRSAAGQGLPYEEVAHFLQPYPDDLLDELPSLEPGSDALVEQRESVGLAFLTAAQLLPPKHERCSCCATSSAGRRARSPRR